MKAEATNKYYYFMEKECGGMEIERMKDRTRPLDGGNRPKLSCHWIVFGVFSHIDFQGSRYLFADIKTLVTQQSSLI